MFQEMTSKLGKDQAELNQILNSAIAQHATKRNDETFTGNKVGFSVDVARIEAEPVYNQTDYSQLANREGDPMAAVDPKVYAACLETAENLMATV